MADETEAQKKKRRAAWVKRMKNKRADAISKVFKPKGEKVKSIEDLRKLAKERDDKS